MGVALAWFVPAPPGLGGSQAPQLRTVRLPFRPGGRQIDCAAPLRSGLCFAIDRASPAHS